MRTGSVGEATASQILAEFPDERYDLVIMNPPFTSNTKHYDADDGVVNAAFAAYEASDKDQADMANRLKQVATGTSYHGHAGLGSAFAALAAREAAPWRSCCPGPAIHRNQRCLVGEVQGVDRNAIYRCDNRKHRGPTAMTCPSRPIQGMAECLIIVER